MSIVRVSSCESDKPNLEITGEKDKPAKNHQSLSNPLIELLLFKGSELTGAGSG